MFDMSSRPSVPPDNKSQMAAVAAVTAILLGMMLLLPGDTMGHGLPIVLVGAGSSGLGAACAWLIKRRRARRAP